MQITKVNIPSDLDPVNNHGLDSIIMDRLEQIVLLAGKNGSGKSRILNRIFTVIGQKPKESIVESYKKRLEEYKGRISTLNESLSLAGKMINDSTRNILERNSIREIQKLEKNISEYKSVINWNAIETNELKNNYPFVYFMPKNLNLIDANNYNKTKMVEHANSLQLVGISGLPTGTFAKIQVVQDRWFNCTHQNSNVPNEEKTLAIRNYEKLKKIINVFLNTELDRSADGDATIFDFKLGQAKLSDGQIILLQLGIAIFSQETALSDLILILDEPENHLHPSVIIEMIERIRDANFNGQIWIATHSIPLLAHFDPNCIWYVESGKIKHAGKIPERVLQSLLGGEEEVSKLQDFISLPSQYASVRFAIESLLEPRVVVTGSNDPQSVQIKSQLQKLSTNGKIRILDFGAGKGRLISNIFEQEEPIQQKLISKIDYIALDQNEKDSEQCKNAISKIYENADNRYFSDIEGVLSKYDRNSFDVIIMCNVLHEIDPKDWLKVFSKDGDIDSLISQNGYLLVVEDQQIPTGEKAYQKGFLVLDTLQLKDLFCVREEDLFSNFSIADQNSDGRLKAHLISAKLLTRISEKSRLNAIKSVSKKARNEIVRIRGLEMNYKNGKLHGFWTQQFANAQLNLEELSSKSE